MHVVGRLLGTSVSGGGSCYVGRVDSTPGAERSDGSGEPTADPAYAERLRSLERRGIRRVVDVQAPYRWNLRRLHLGRVLDVGCGLGRNLLNLGAGSVGVDHNPDSIAIAKARGLNAYTIEEFLASPAARPAGYDTLLYAHVLEHMSREAAVQLLRDYLPFLATDGRVCIITPQERGYASDATHVEFVDFDGIRSIAAEAGLAIDRAYSFPLPRLFGRVFTYNEFVAVATRRT